MAGEVGLSGEIRPVNRLEQRLMEAQKLGFSQIIVPKLPGNSLDLSRFTLTIHQVTKVEEVFRLLFA